MRVYLESRRHFLNLRFGRKEDHEDEGDPAPDHTTEPMVVYAEPLGFRTTGPGEGFTTGDLCQTEERPSSTASSTPTRRGSA